MQTSDHRIKKLPIIPRFHCVADRKHEAEVIRAMNMERQAGPIWDTYAGCDRAPFGWELAQPLPGEAPC